ncbi:hypothetical protein VTK73DRAFT_5080 [Phialemonium thermophilum]|uniref:Uncharacterized protein n=1 Tax=Phialemonium thermophilum TaxID=223376 RepID=A0ABR3WQ50_9PEZI
MAQKSQNAGGADGQPSTSASSAASRDTSGPPTTVTSRKSSVTLPALNGSTTSTVLPKMSDPAPPPLPSTLAASQPMEKSVSNGSNLSAKDNATSGTASPYGTRSRNRTGASRINYAEDKDIDMDLFEMYPERREDEAKKSARHAAATSATQSHAAPRSTSGTARKPLPTGDHKSTGSNQHSTAKEQNSVSTPDSISGSNSTASAQPSKKRKAASQTSSSTAASQSQPAAPNAHSAALQKRLGAVSRGGVGYPETNMLTFEKCKAMPKDGKMVADDGTVLEVNDHVYLVCEPPGEPYYLGRIMEFLHAKNDPSRPVDALRINWYYRPKDIGRKVQDTRMVFATMHSDISPLTSLRGKCQIKHKSEIPDLAEYKRTPDCFWYEKLYDRYIQKNYEVIPTSQIVNVPERVKKVLDERWKYILVEQGRGKELTSAVKLCKRCSGYCASNDSVDCAVCGNTYHMNCVRPPLLKKPSRGFAWSCAACSRAQERKLEARNTPNVLDAGAADVEDEEYVDDEEDDAVAAGTGGTTLAEEEHHVPATAEQIYHASLWPYRYLGIHCKVEDALDYDDRIFPRASTRLGPRHQANVLPWPGRPVQYVKPVEIKKTNRKDGKVSKEVQAAIEQERIKREKRPKWIQDEPPGYVPRGEDYDNDDPRNTAQLLWKPPADVGVDMPAEELDAYMKAVKSMAVPLGLPPRSTNLLDVARDVLFKNKFDTTKSLQELPKLDKSVFKEPELTSAEQKKFEEGIQKFGSELHSVMKHVKTVSPANITRYYYTWKKTERGKQIWGSYAARKGKKEAKKAEAAANRLADDVADDQDDSAFDTEKAMEKKKGFMCKFCSTKTSRQWRRAPNASSTLVTEGSGGSGGKSANKDKNGQYIQALCRRCAELWRRYAIQWEDVEEVAKKVAQTGGRSWRRRVDEELYKELVAADEMMSKTRYLTPESSGAAGAGAGKEQQTAQEPPRKKLKGAPEKDADQTASENGTPAAAAHTKKKEKAAEKQPPPPEPEMPKPKTMPCAICLQLEPLGDQHLSCKECRMTVHRNCYGVIDNRAPGKWTCDMCLNDKNPQVSIHYKCVLCPVEYTEHDFVEPPKPTHKKRSEKEREREKAERELAQKAAEYYRKKQEEMNRPVNPREPLKRTADNNWIHVTCAVWTPEVKFGMAKALGPCEGIPSIPRSRFAEVCKVCKKRAGACVACHQCRAPVHVECAHQAGYLLGFDITPVKSSRRDQVNVVTMNGETGIMSAAIWCKEHVPTKTIVHRMHDTVDDGGLNALQLYVQNFKQADLTLTGCARKANQISSATKMSTSASSSSASGAHAQNRRVSTAPLTNGDKADHAPSTTPSGDRVCITCGVDVSPRWYAVDPAVQKELTDGYHTDVGTEAKKFIEQRSFQCHKCKKANRQPRHLSASKPSRTPTPEPAPKLEPELEPLQPPLRAPLATPPLLVQEPRHLGRGPFSWSPPLQAASGPGLMVPPVAMQAPVLGPPPASLPHHQSVGPPPVAPLGPALAPRGPPMPSHAYPPPPSSYNDWPRAPHGGPAHPVHSHRDVNGGPPLAPNPMQPLAPPNHLRQPPISSIHPPLPSHAPHPMHNGQLVQPPFVNGLPPSPRRLNGPPPPPAPPPQAVQNGAPYPPPPPPPPQPPQSYHSSVVSHSHSPEYGGGAGHGLSSILRHRNPPPLSAQHGSPPMPRDSLPMNRESSRPPQPPPPPPPPQQDNRRPSGASASPSLRNLLS